MAAQVKNHGHHFAIHDTSIAAHSIKRNIKGRKSKGDGHLGQGHDIDRHCQALLWRISVCIEYIWVTF